ncbi:MAG TPA: DUF4431 domain-containing protein [Bacteroidia bacterium]|nr:DUF4431 domain-containing protein [Bacteroidia bacterium]
MTVVISFITIINTPCLAQSLTYQDLKFVMEHSVEDADNYLSKKDFLYYRTENEENRDCKTIFWSLNRDSYSNRAVAFISKYCFEPNNGFVWCQLGDRKSFDNIKSSCRALKFRQSTTEIDTLGSLCTTYQNDKYNIEFCSGLNSGTNRNDYTITLSIKKKTQKKVNAIKIYANQKCTLVGNLQLQLFYGAPNFGEDTLTDEKEYSYILNLENPILFLDSELGSGEWETVTKIQVITNRMNLANFINKKVIITCTLVAAHTGHHHAPAITWELFDINLSQ